MRCAIKGCPGHYEKKAITHAIRKKEKVVVIDHVPARICDTCGDILLELKTIRRIEKIISAPGKTRRSAPLYDYA